MRLLQTPIFVLIACTTFGLAIVAMPSAARARGAVAFSGSLFAFHNGFWVNLHHFLYYQAVASRPQVGRRNLVVRKVDLDELAQLSPAERAVWDKAVSDYADTLAGKDLLFDDGLQTIKDKLEDAEASPDLGRVQIPIRVRAILLRAAPIYRKYWWPRHDAENQRWIAELTPLVKAHGRPIAAELGRIYDQPWPDHPVRVDVVVYANWAGAYTTIFPTRPTLSSTDPRNQGLDALEIVFHETSHGMVSKVRTALDAAAKDLNSRPGAAAFHVGDMWHAVLFYTAGELVKQQAPGHVPYADRNELWARAWPSPDRTLIEKDWRPHMAGAEGLQPALSKLAADLAAAQPIQPPGG